MLQAIKIILLGLILSAPLLGQRSLKSDWWWTWGTLAEATSPSATPADAETGYWVGWTAMVIDSSFTRPFYTGGTNGGAHWNNGASWSITGGQATFANTGSGALLTDSIYVAAYDADSALVFHYDNGDSLGMEFYLSANPVGFQTRSIHSGSNHFIGYAVITGTGIKRYKDLAIANGKQFSWNALQYGTSGQATVVDYIQYYKKANP